MWNVTSQGLRGLDIDWEEELEAVNVFRIKREVRMPVFWRTYTATPSERIA